MHELSKHMMKLAGFDDDMINEVENDDFNEEDEEDED